MQTVPACGGCRNTCATCGSHTNASHPIWVCMDCNKKYSSKCPVCGKARRGQVGAGKVCDSCFKTNTCSKCGAKI